ncbi:MAG: tRNA (adenosine(37)-N6)-threonylcarbamoyltransferase complex dimerization subunit type 1 TsaB [SAR86 cluster bacterium]|uniref:tRNA threonylcarbamoyladenosine biosynthesis protein TsaB n=1 Tax=SAR86 cluster bacterium TaxID=2030880 RepID=A0A2A5AZ89_9GAMM|nr:MAG: tRNA (adenosine(37)-N6)-threonylcarbamoyltransferase complex dimerization subunit type 1 TsaB [SAR86 cluster bacterium]
MFMMKNILAIDTSSQKCSVAVSTNNQLFQQSSELERQSAQRILPMVAELLVDAKFSLPQLDLIAVIAGPGSFTGLRIGIGVAQGLSAANSTPVIALSSLAVTAMAANRMSSFSQFFVSEVAREREIYFAAYRISKRLGVELCGHEQVSVPELLQPPHEAIKGEPWCAVGKGWANRVEIQSRLNCPIENTIIEPEVNMSDICKLAELRFAAGDAVSAELLRPNYVKDKLDY